MAQWIKLKFGVYECSACKWHVHEKLIKGNYCPNCGEPTREGFSRSTKKGKWISRKGKVFLAEDHDCSECGAWGNKTRYCIECGARMVNNNE